MLIYVLWCADDYENFYFSCPYKAVEYGRYLQQKYNFMSRLGYPLEWHVQAAKLDDPEYKEDLWTCFLDEFKQDENYPEWVYEQWPNGLPVKKEKHEN